MYLVFDIGGTHIRMAIAGNGKIHGSPLIMHTPKKFTEAMVLFCVKTKELVRGRKISAMSGGIAGTLDNQKRKLLYSPNLVDWIDKPLYRELSKGLRVRLHIENDAALGALGEARFGAGKKKRIVAYITISTGVGGARVVDGHIDVAAFGFEPGTDILRIDRKNAVYDAESLLSGAGLQKKYGLKPEFLFREVIWHEERLHLAYLLNDVVAFWSPDIIVLGGAITRNEHMSLPKIKKQLGQVMVSPIVMPQIVKSSLGDSCVLWGALAALQE